MSLLWTQAMAWSEDTMGGRDKRKYTPIHVKQAGYAGVVGDHEDDKEMAEETGQAKHEDEWDEDLWDESTPEPTSHEQRHFEEHDEYPESHFERHDVAYGEAVQRRNEERAKSPYDHEDPELRHFVSQHGSNTKLWHDYGRSGKVNLRQPVYATQTHVAREHLDKYHANPNAVGHHQTYFPHAGQDYLGSEHPLFVTHQNRLHVIEGHHRVGAELEKHSPHMYGHHFNLDEHPQFGNGEVDEEDYE
jgi:hypothetical protein